MRPTRLLPVLVLVLSLAGCGGDQPAPQPEPESMPPPDRVTVDHILIGVQGNPRLPQAKYDREEARRVAYDLLEKLRGGADWAEAKQTHSDDRGPGRPPGGPYAMVNDGVPPRDRSEFPRGGMAKAFGDVGFSLRVGEIGIADYDPGTSPFGFHIIKRVK